MGDDGRDPDDVVGQLRPVPADGDRLPESDYVVLLGYFGDGDGDTHRIYVDQELDEYIQVPAEAVAYRQRVDDPDVYAQRSAVWVKRDALMEEIVYPGGFERDLIAMGIGQRLPKNKLDVAFDLTIVCIKTNTGNKVCSIKPCWLAEALPGGA